MVPLRTLFSFTTSPLLLVRSPPHPRPTFLAPFRKRLSINSVQNEPPKTLFPGGYKRADIKVPNIVVQVTPEDVINNVHGLDTINEAVAEKVGIVVVSGGEGGKLLYEAACLLKSVIRDRAYLLVGDRVDIASAVNASGVLLSDQGLPPIVARNTMMFSKSDSVILPVVARMIHTLDTAITASNSEGADFLILSPLNPDFCWDSITQNVKIPVFSQSNWFSDDASFDKVSKMLSSGASGIVLTLDEFMSCGDSLAKLVYHTSLPTHTHLQNSTFGNMKLLNNTNVFTGELGIGSFVKLEESEAQFINKERSLLVAALHVLEKAAPMMEEISLLTNAISQLDEPFLLVIVGEFNSGKSTFINALLGGKFLKDGVVPTTNEITFLRYSESYSKEKQYCERHPDGENICYLPAQILKKMIIVDTPGTNVILQRQQRLTEEFVPRADLLLFVLSADRPLTESEVAFLRYTQQWKKKAVFLLNKADIYRDSCELDEAISFVRENLQKLLNEEDVKLFPISARSALEAKLAAFDVNVDQQGVLVSETYSSFNEFENFLNDFLDGSTSAGLERMKIKLETPLAIAGRLISSCQTLVMQDYRIARKNLMYVTELKGSVKDYAQNMESESISWKRQISSLVGSAKLRVLKLVESTLQLSNLDFALSSISKGGKSASIPATQSTQNDILSPVLSDVERLLVEYNSWLQENYLRKVTLYEETFEKGWPSVLGSLNQGDFVAKYLVKQVDGQSLKLIKKYSGAATTNLFDQEIREVFLGAFGGLGAAGLSASLLTSVLPTTLEDLLALGLCSAWGLLAISNFPTRRQKVIDKVKSIADAVSQEVEEAMQKDLLETVDNLEYFLTEMGKPYEEAAQNRLDQLMDTQEKLTDLEKKLQTLQIELQNFSLS